ncbi:ABC-type bacteriocin/lantibiotic exporter with N-terminal double-glycine peptidase domain [Bernardetia litoralis DSM 6794]|uniref:ABC-type bacteriocin/lantibiotic exporter with N-terminal double-glycine peptidase domain n=1 Tax=Bernardetia litoralis (strain ATCC 23117 / DSM 6794 / NBRC 15988 / NCIMB 1366 / Fx l1 / Sio-4) TaxID=880071 RepID=I4AHC2_BERLS|nr:cysteine peptidase family C39 domain-containing protein [Bernardetia litoralis]AFM03357.1 ABC-type bacteriocin/lantibiotic exporter with N-terminal double-glycine peptidase domain [Bernardetia litoralis DSM 6794]
MKTIISILLDKLEVSYTPVYLQKLTEKCNQAQTLSDITLLLAYYKVESLAVQIGREELSEIPLPALVLASQKDENGKTHNDYSILEEVRENEVALINVKAEKEIIQIEDFEKSWTGYTLLLDKNENAAESNYLAHKKAEKKQSIFDSVKTIIQVLVGISFLFLIGKSFSETSTNNVKSIFEISFYVLHSVGFIISAILLSGEIFKENVIFKKACKALGKSSCADTNTTEKSKIESLKKWFTFSELGIYYFFGAFLFLVISKFQNDFLAFMLQSLFSVLGIFAVITSLYYQKFILKKWCSLCVSVMAVLFIESVLGGMYLFISQNDLAEITISPLLSPFAIAIFSFLLPVFVWNILKPILTKYNSYKNEMKNLHSFKYDFEVFKTLLYQSKRIDVSEVPTHFVEGNTASDENPVSLVVISRPTCPPCISAKKDLQKLRENFGSYFKMTTCHLTANQTSEDYKQISELLSKLPTSYSEVEKEHIISHHYAWINQQEISFTPAFILNGYLLPEKYTVSDLNYFMVHLANEMEEEIQINQEELVS